MIYRMNGLICFKIIHVLPKLILWVRLPGPPRNLILQLADVVRIALLLVALCQ